MLNGELNDGKDTSPCLIHDNYTEFVNSNTLHKTSVMTADREPQCLPVGVCLKLHRPIAWTFHSNLCIIKTLLLEHITNIFTRTMKI